MSLHNLDQKWYSIKESKECVRGNFFFIVCCHSALLLQMWCMSSLIIPAPHSMSVFSFNSVVRWMSQITHSCFSGGNSWYIWETDFRSWVGRGAALSPIPHPHTPHLPLGGAAGPCSQMATGSLAQGWKFRGWRLERRELAIKSCLKTDWRICMWRP